MKYVPSREEFDRLASEYPVVPVYREIFSDMDTPVSALSKLESTRSAFLLESVEGGERWARHSFLGTDPKLVVQGREGQAVTANAEDSYTAAFSDPLSFLEGLMGEYRAPSLPGLPSFCGGAVGYLSYDTIRYFEPVPVSGEDELRLPEFLFMLADSLIVFDHLQHSMKVVQNAMPAKEGAGSYDVAVARIEELIEQLRRPTLHRPAPATGENGAVVSNMAPERFLAIVERAKEHIRAGDIFQAVLSQRLSADLKASPFDVYRVLRRVNPSPYMYYLRHGDLAIVGSSPEPLVRVEGEGVVTRPIAGTRRRGRTPEDDLRLERELLADAKERAEHIMLVDLGRNDLGRVCRPGTVRVEELMVVERYSHVMHMVSSVVGKLAPGHSAFDVLRAAFPAGTVSGAPKIRAMEIIDELEPSRRGPYAGAIGYFSFSGSLDTCITIRTIITQGSKAYVQAGAGIVADSIPERELLETENKARALLASLELAEEGKV